MLDKKLNIKDGCTVSLVSNPYAINIAAARVDVGIADVVILFVINKAELDDKIPILIDASVRGAITWLAYPKAKQLSTDLNRNIIHDSMPIHGLDAIRQVAIDGTWSALRFKKI